MNKLVSMAVVLVLGLAFLRAAGPTLVQLINALSVLGIVIGVVGVVWRLARYYTRQ
jgi:hypothetical protein